MKRYNDHTLDQTRPRASKYSVAIGAGLHLVIYPSGVKSFGRIEKNARGNNQLRPFAPFKSPSADASAPGALTLQEAKTWMHEHAIAHAHAQAEHHHDRTRAKIEITFEELISEWHRRKIAPRNDCAPARKARYLSTLLNHFCKSTVPEIGGPWGTVRLARFNGVEWAERYEHTLYAIERRQAAGGDRRGKSTLGHEVDQFMQLVFDYAIKHGYLNPAHRPPRNTSVRKPRAVTRWLSIAEIERAFAVTTKKAVHGNDAINEQDACFLRVLLLAGIRLNSVRLARRSSMHVRDKDFWTFPADDLKTTSTQRAVEYDHHVPLTALLATELARLDATVNRGVDCFFAERYHFKRDAEAVQPRSRSWAGHLVAEFAGLLGCEGSSEYRAHAFRRTQSNWMRELGVADHIINLCQARVPRETAKTYLTAEARDQVVNAFELYHAFLDACMQGKGQAFIDAVRDRRRSDARKEIAALRHAAKVRPLVA